MGKKRTRIREREKPAGYQPISSHIHVLTREQAKAFERRQAEPPRQPTEAGLEAVRMFNATVKR